MFFQIARKTILLLVNNIHEKIYVNFIFICSVIGHIGMRNYSKAHIKINYPFILNIKQRVYSFSLCCIAKTKAPFT